MEAHWQAALATQTEHAKEEEKLKKHWMSEKLAVDEVSGPACTCACMCRMCLHMFPPLAVHEYKSRRVALASPPISLRLALV